MGGARAVAEGSARCGQGTAERRWAPWSEGSGVGLGTVGMTGSRSWGAATGTKTGDEQDHVVADVIDTAGEVCVERRK